jgi:hypothetical protein
MSASPPHRTALRRNAPLRRVLNVAFRLLVLGLLGAVLWAELRGRDNLSEIKAAFWRQLRTANPLPLLLALALVPFNWLAETAKWHPFLRRHEPMSRWRALSAVLAGLCFALFTPNRVGEYAGRLLFVRPEHHWKSLVINAVGGIAQYIALLTGGVLGGLWFAGRWLHWSPQLLAGAGILAVLGLLALHCAYFNIAQLIPLGRRIPWLRRLKPYVRDVGLLAQFSRRDLLAILLWSVLRYAIYSSQYVLLLHFFAIPVSIWAAYAGVATIYLLQTVVPLPAIAGLLVRGNLAVFVWSQFGGNTLAALAATFVLWIINLILPALIGTFSLFHVRITKTIGYEDD